jgi:3-oxoacyl-[acyl-carrier protein] reductase
MDAFLKDKTVLVTGSGQGIGRAIALAFGKAGARVVTNNRKPGGSRFSQLSDQQYAALGEAERARYDHIFAGLTGDAESSAAAIRAAGGEAVAAFGDIADAAVAERIVAEACRAFGQLDILVNVAGAFGGGKLSELSEEEYDRITRVKVKGYFNMVKYAIPGMEARGWGRIINCSSKSMMGDVVRMAHYCVANAAAYGLTMAAACEYYSAGITCNAFSPFARTRNSYEADIKGGPGEPIVPDLHFPDASAAPDPDLLTPFLLWLCSDAAAEVTGSLFTLNGNSIGLHQLPLKVKTMFKAGSDPWTLDEINRDAPRALFQGYQNVLHFQ